MQKKKQTVEQRREQLRSELRRDVLERRSGYRAKALQLFPHLCASCGREFVGARMKELTVHHKDHDHENNPPDGSNWELLCIYCHDHEHEKGIDARLRTTAPAKEPEAEGLGNPFANLDNLLG